MIIVTRHGKEDIAGGLVRFEEIYLLFEVRDLVRGLATCYEIKA